MSRILIVEDDRTTRRILTHWLGKAGHEVIAHDTAAGAMGADSTGIDVACVDLGLGRDSGLDLMRHLKARDPNLAVIIVTARSDASSAVEAMRAGAYDYVTKPIEQERLLTSVARAAEHRRLLDDVKQLTIKLEGHTGAQVLIGESPVMQHLAAQIGRVVDSDVPVCILGESGTGKELVARAVHDRGRRAPGPFVAVNCGAIPESLQEAELFGAERGAYTGAHATRPGRFEQAEGGTLFLDELGEMSPGTQAALLRTLQERTLRRVGGTKEIHVDTRVVCATHRDLEDLVRAGRFRKDLYFRLVVFPLEVPPLRERTSDIPALVAHFLRKLERDVGRCPERISPDAMAAMTDYAWPGNVRELQNAIHRAMLASDGDVLELSHLPPNVQRSKLGTLQPLPESVPVANAPEVLNLRELERRTIRRALEKTNGNMTEAARMLGIGRATLYRKVANYDVVDAA